MSVSFRTREYGESNNSVAASLVAGFTGKITDFETAARSLLVCGHDVVAYEYDNDVLLAGDATLLPQLIADISNDFQLRAREHPIHRHAGASLGGVLPGTFKNTAQRLLRACSLPQAPMPLV